MAKAKAIALGALALLAAPALSGCGFTPLYATADPASRPTLQNVGLDRLEASEAMAPILVRALERRMAVSPSAAPFGVDITVRESAVRLGVQIDSSATRYNYRLHGNYRLIDRRTGLVAARGAVSATTSFNVVNSQYSTLFAETSAREKAARVLVEEVERDILIKLASGEAATVRPDPERLDDDDPVIPLDDMIR